jgi:23S rRNA (cytosine1962-C5)-methyltransferase
MMLRFHAWPGCVTVLAALRGQPADHPEVLTIPEMGYIKGALVEALD